MYALHALYRLNREYSVRLLPVIRIVDGPIGPLPCLCENGAQTCDECTGERFETRIIMRQVRDAVTEVLDHTTLAEVCARSDAERGFTYEI